MQSTVEPDDVSSAATGSPPRSGRCADRENRAPWPTSGSGGQWWALLDVPDPIPVIDGLPAATAIEHDLVLVTRNTADVELTGAATENPFAEER